MLRVTSVLLASVAPSWAAACQDMRLTFVGQGYVEDVSWDLPPSDSPPTEGAAKDESDLLRMGETCTSPATQRSVLAVQFLFMSAHLEVSGARRHEH